MELKKTDSSIISGSIYIYFSINYSFVCRNCVFENNFTGLTVWYKDIPKAPITSAVKNM